MKRIQIVFVALLLFTGIVVAQPNVSGHSKHSHFDSKEMLLDKLNLTDDQKAKMKAANEDFKKQMQALNGNDNQTVKQQREAREALLQLHKAQVENILTADQKSQLALLKKDSRAQHGEMNGKQSDKIKQKLNLTDQQVSQLQSSQAVTKSKMEAINNNTSLDPTAKKQQLQALRNEMKNSIEQVLTPEQKEKWQDMMKNRPHGPHTQRGDYKVPTS